jgi:hypothetical protein
MIVTDLLRKGMKEKGVGCGWWDVGVCWGWLLIALWWSECGGRCVAGRVGDAAGGLGGRGGVLGLLSGFWEVATRVASLRLGNPSLWCAAPLGLGDG